MSVTLEGKFGSFLRIETKGLERLHWQTVQAVNGSACSQKDSVEAFNWARRRC